MCNIQESQRSRQKWHYSIFISHLQSCLSQKERLAYISSLSFLSIYFKFYSVLVSLTTLAPNPQKVKFSNCKCQPLMYALHAVWVSEHLDDHIKIFLNQQHRLGKINTLGKTFPYPWFRTAFKHLRSLLFKTTRPLITRATCGLGGRGWSPKSAVLTAWSSALDTFSIRLI